jgi:hypothetical protein
VVARFAQLAIDSSAAASQFTSIAELNLLGADGTPLDRSQWTVSADSTETAYQGGAAASFAIDGDSGTMWHTPWSVPAQVTDHPHFFQIDLGQPRDIIGFRYLPRQDLTNDGRIAAYRFLLSSDGISWGQPLVSGVFPDSSAEQEVRLP